MSSLPPEANNTLLSLLEGLMTANNEVRANAERTLEHDWYTVDNLGMLLLFLTEQAVKGANDTIRSFAAVLFRRYSLKLPPGNSSMTISTLETIPDPVRQEIRKLLYDGFVSQQSNGVRHKLADAISEVAKKSISPPGTWDDLIPTLFQATSSQDVSFRESSFRVFGSQPSIVQPYHEQFLPILNNAFSDPQDSVRVAASNAFVAYFQSIPRKQWGSCSPLLPTLLNSLPKYLEEDKEEALTNMLESLIELASLAPKMFKSMLQAMIEFCSTIVKNNELESSTRLAALELLTTFCETSPNMCKSEPMYSETMVVLNLQLMTEICIDDEEAVEWNSNAKDSIDEEEYEAARNALDRAALSLGGQILAEPLFKYLTQMLSSQQWRERQAALMALSAAAEGCADVLMGEIPQILDLILPCLNDVHPRVQYACCNALGQISTDFADIIQRSSGDRILPALISKLTNDSVPRVQTHAAAALVNFSENATKEILEPYLDSLLTNLLTLLQGPYVYVQEQVLTTIAIVADAAESHFIKYYDTLMPLLFQVLKSDLGKENSLLKAKSIECSTLIASAVGKEKFAPHSQELIQVFTHLQQSLDDSDDDPIKPYLQQGWNTVCSIIGQDFLPFLPLVLPPLIKQAKAEQEIKFVEEGDDVAQDEAWDVYPLAGKQIALHTALLDEKVFAMEILKSYAEYLKASFSQYVPMILKEISLPALDFYFHDGVRDTAASSLEVYLASVAIATGAKSEQTMQMWASIANKLIESLKGEPLTDVLVCYYGAFHRCLGIVGEGSLSSEQLQGIVNSMRVNLQAVYERIKERIEEEEGNGEEFDEGLDEENREFTDEELLDEINVTIATLFKFFKSDFLTAFNDLMPVVSAFLSEDIKALKLFGLSAISDLIENVGAQSTNYREVFINGVGESLSSPESAIRELGALVVGTAALHGGPDYTEFVVAALEPLFASVNEADSKSEEKISATENCLTAIAKILHVHGDKLDKNRFDSMVANWVQGLPITIDNMNIYFCYSFLTDLVEKKNEAVYKDFAKVLKVLLEFSINNKGTSKIVEKAVVACKQLCTYVPQDYLQSFVSNCSGPEQELIKSFFN